jgi:hypothetical protein
MATPTHPEAQAFAAAADALQALADFGEVIAMMGRPEADPSPAALERMGASALAEAGKALAALATATVVRSGATRAEEHAETAADFASLVATLGAAEADPRPRAVARLGQAIREAAVRALLELDGARAPLEAEPA